MDAPLTRKALQPVRWLERGHAPWGRHGLARLSGALLLAMLGAKVFWPGDSMPCQDSMAWIVPDRVQPDRMERKPPTGRAERMDQGGRAEGTETKDSPQTVTTRAERRGRALATQGHRTPLDPGADFAADFAVDPAVDPSEDFAPGASPERTLRELNQVRSRPRQCGEQEMPAAGPLRWSPQALQAARTHADYLRTHNVFGHDGRNGSRVGERLSATGLQWRKAGENLAAGQDTLEEVMAGWLASPTHCRVLMSATFELAALVRVPGGQHNTYSSYWALVLAEPAAPAAPAPVAEIGAEAAAGRRIGPLAQSR